MRVWIEPSTIIAEPNQTIRLPVMAEIDDQNNLFPFLSFSITPSDPSLIIEPFIINYDKPFGGKITAGEILITPTQYGVFSISIPEDQVNVGEKNMNIITAGAKIIVQ